MHHLYPPLRPAVILASLFRFFLFLFFNSSFSSVKVFFPHLRSLQQSTFLPMYVLFTQVYNLASTIHVLCSRPASAKPLFISVFWWWHWWLPLYPLSDTISQSLSLLGRRNNLQTFIIFASSLTFLFNITNLLGYNYRREINPPSPSLSIRLGEPQPFPSKMLFSS